MNALGKFVYLISTRSRSYEPNLVLFYLKCWFSPNNFEFIEIFYEISEFGYGGN